MPIPQETVTIEGECVVVEAGTLYRGKTNGYMVDRRSILEIVDKAGRHLEGRWEADWIEIAQGIQTRGERLVQRSSLGEHNHEAVKTASVRIHRSACPVHIHFCNTFEYNDYDNAAFSSSQSTEYWICYDS
jgi:hypothetical protein